MYDILECISGTVGHNTMCYKLHKQKATWDDAKEACEQGETELASASDEATNNFLSTTFGKTEAGHAWLGGYREVVTNTSSWKWTDKKWGPKNWGFTNWAPGEPKNDSYLVTNYIKSGQWDDQEKDTENNFICQMSKKGF